MRVPVFHDEAAVLQSLLEVGVNLSVIQDREAVLAMILSQARRLARAEAGTLYVISGQELQAEAVQNDRVPPDAIKRWLGGRKLTVGDDSLAGFVAATGQTVNIPNTYELDGGSPFRVRRDMDAATGFRTVSVLIIPLNRPGGQCLGVLQLINHVKGGGEVSAFPDEAQAGTVSLASMAAVTLHNAILQDQLKQAQLDCIIRLSVAAEFRDDDTADHVRRISCTSALIAESLGVSGEQVEMIRHASPMHDIGKIGIPDAILLKRGPLTAAERRIVETHPQIGADILGDPPNDLIALAREVALAHHERWDGGGYPSGLAGEVIPLSGRIVGLADVFDALVSKRCYKDAFPLDKALTLVRNDTGKHFDPGVSEAFFATIDRILDYYRQTATESHGS